MTFLIKNIVIIAIFLAVFGNTSNYSSAATGEENGTGVTEENKALMLNGVEVIGKNTIELKFATDIEDNDDKDIIVRLLGDSPKEIFVLDFDIKEKSVKLILEEDIESNKTYEVIIFSITGKDGSTITSGLDGAIKFISEDLSRFNIEEEQIDLESASNEIDLELEKEKLAKEEMAEIEKERMANGMPGMSGINSGDEMSGINSGDEMINDSISKDNLGGKNIDKEEMDKNIEMTAANKEELVKTGPEHVLLVILALILAALIGYIFKGKKAIKI